MIESEDASSVAATLAKNLMGVAKNKSSFEKLPDNFWGYYQPSHDVMKSLDFGLYAALTCIARGNFCITKKAKYSDRDSLKGSGNALSFSIS